LPVTAAREPQFSDVDLLCAMREGDRALEMLYDRYNALVYRVSNRMLNDPAAAEDIVQHVFLSVWSAPPTICTGSFAAWLTFVTKNRVRDMLRTRMAHREEEWPVNLADDRRLDEQVHQRLECARVRAAVAALPKSQRALIELGFYGGYSHAELAMLTQVPLGTIKTRIRSGLRKLRFVLARPEGTQEIRESAPCRTTARLHPSPMFVAADPTQM
jgi:RNA polymerase sigma-70 factor (ECF subfamily)